MRDPISKLALLDVDAIDASIRKALPEVFVPRPHFIPALFYAGRFTKKTKFDFTEKQDRIMLISSTHVLTYKPTGAASRAIPITSISEVLIFPDSCNVIRCPEGADFVFRLEVLAELDYIVNILQVVRKFYEVDPARRFLPVRGMEGSWSAYADLNLSRRSNKAEQITSDKVKLPMIRSTDQRSDAVDVFLRPPKPPKPGSTAEPVVKALDNKTGHVLAHPLFHPPDSSEYGKNVLMLNDILSLGGGASGGAVGAVGAAPSSPQQQQQSVAANLAIKERSEALTIRAELQAEAAAAERSALQTDREALERERAALAEERRQMAEKAEKEAAEREREREKERRKKERAEAKAAAIAELEAMEGRGGGTASGLNASTPPPPPPMSRLPQQPVAARPQPLSYEEFVRQTELGLDPSAHHQTAADGDEGGAHAAAAAESLIYGSPHPHSHSQHQMYSANGVWAGGPPPGASMHHAAHPYDHGGGGGYGHHSYGHGGGEHEREGHHHHHHHVHEGGANGHGHGERGMAGESYQQQQLSSHTSQRRPAPTGAFAGVSGTSPTGARLLPGTADASNAVLAHAFFPPPPPPPFPNPTASASAAAAPKRTSAPAEGNAAFAPAPSAFSMAALPSDNGAVTRGGGGGGITSGSGLHVPPPTIRSASLAAAESVAAIERHLAASGMCPRERLAAREGPIAARQQEVAAMLQEDSGSNGSSAANRSLVATLRIAALQDELTELLSRQRDDRRAAAAEAAVAAERGRLAAASAAAAEAEAQQRAALAQALASSKGKAKSRRRRRTSSSSSSDDDSSFSSEDGESSDDGNSSSSINSSSRSSSSSSSEGERRARRGHGGGRKQKAAKKGRDAETKGVVKGLSVTATPQPARDGVLGGSKAPPSVASSVTGGKQRVPFEAAAAAQRSQPAAADSATAVVGNAASAVSPTPEQRAYAQWYYSQYAPALAAAASSSAYGGAPPLMAAVPPPSPAYGYGHGYGPGSPYAAAPAPAARGGLQHQQLNASSFHLAGPHSHSSYQHHHGGLQQFGSSFAVAGRNGGATATALHFSPPPARRMGGTPATAARAGAPQQGMGVHQGVGLGSGPAGRGRESIH